MRQPLPNFPRIKSAEQIIPHAAGQKRHRKPADDKQHDFLILPAGLFSFVISQVINSQNWNVGTNLTTGEKGWSDVEAEAILSGRLLNNRLIINGNFGYRENTLQNTNFVGDFEAIWLLTPNGEFRLRGYNQTNDRYFTKSTLTTQGIGLMYKKDFTNWRELFDWFLRRKRNRATRQAEEEERKAALQNQPAAQQKREQE